MVLTVYHKYSCTKTNWLNASLHTTVLICLHSTAGVSGQAENVPLHSAHLEEFLPELQSLITYFHLSYDTRKLRTTADEMELFSMVMWFDRLQNMTHKHNPGF